MRLDMILSTLLLAGSVSAVPAFTYVPKARGPQPTAHKKGFLATTTKTLFAAPKPTTIVQAGIPPPPKSATTTTASVPPSASATGAGASVAAPSASAPPTTDYIGTALWHHNVHRANHSAPALVHNATLAGYAATVAAKCVFAHDRTPGGGGYGQNIASYGSSAAGLAAQPAGRFAARAITEQWYNGEFAAFRPEYYGQPTPDMAAFEAWGHLTQVVWRGSRSVGCASQLCAAGTLFAGFPSWFTVCNYGPAGNYLGQFADNVARPAGNATVNAL